MMLISGWHPNQVLLDILDTMKALKHRKQEIKQNEGKDKENLKK
jgi:hypothetical protein